MNMNVFEFLDRTRNSGVFPDTESGITRDEFNYLYDFNGGVVAVFSFGSAEWCFDAPESLKRFNGRLLSLFDSGDDDSEGAGERSSVEVLMALMDIKHPQLDGHSLEQ